MIGLRPRLKLLVMWALKIESPSIATIRATTEGVRKGLDPDYVPGTISGVPTLREALQGRYSGWGDK